MNDVDEIKALLVRVEARLRVLTNAIGALIAALASWFAYHWVINAWGWSRDSGMLVAVVVCFAIAAAVELDYRRARLT